MTNNAFPVDEICADLASAVSSHNIIVSAPPGAGKSTRTPLYLLRKFPEKNFIMLQPRRVVARHLASFLASQLGEKLGDTVGYQIRGESKTSAATRLTIMTEGILTKKLQSNPELTGTDVIIFDEFHERSVHLDLGLAFSIECQQVLREDLRLIVMSATLDLGALGTLLPDAKRFTSHGRMYPVEHKYLGDVKSVELASAVSKAVNLAFNETDTGDVLIFLSSAKLIRLCRNALSEQLTNQHKLQICELYGAMPLQKQTAVLKPSIESLSDSQNIRRIILATNIAETSLTIEGVTVVIDSGREQQVSFDVKTATTSLTTRMISKASAVQRSGRAGRVRPGTCYRLWSSSTQERLEQNSRANILETDLTPHLLDVLNWGSSFEQLAILDQPSKAQLDHAKTRLERLGMLENNTFDTHLPTLKLTDLARKASQQALHPRITAMLFASNQPYEVEKAVAATLLEHAKDITHLDYGFEQTTLMSETSIRNFVSDLSNKASKRIPRSVSKTFHNVLQALDAHMSLESVEKQLVRLDTQRIATFIAIAYPERVAVQLNSQSSSVRYKLTFGPRFNLRDAPSDFSQHNVAASLDSLPKYMVVLQASQMTNTNATNSNTNIFNVFTALACDFHQLKQEVPHLFHERQIFTLERNKQQLMAKQEYYIGDTLYDSQPLQNQQQINWSDAWLQTIKAGHLENNGRLFPFSTEAEQLLTRISIAIYLELSEFKKVDDFSEENLLRRADEWLTDSIMQCRTIKALEELPWEHLLESLLTWPQKQTLVEYLPSKINDGTGNARPLEYRFVRDREDSIELSCIVKGKLQTWFGINQPIRLCNNSIVVTVELLSPAGRLLQTTQDLGTFWTGSYHQVVKDMRGRYPKHPWPDDPISASAFAGTKKALENR